MKKLTMELIKLIADNQLSEGDVMLVKMRLAMTPPDIAEKLGTSRQMIHQRLQSIDTKIANQLDLGRRGEL